jgi:hypothetical protein
MMVRAILSRTKPERAIVTLNVALADTGKKAKAPVIVPNDPEIRASFAHAEKHPEFPLSRREIIKYVLADAGQRADEIQALFRI